MSFHFEANLDYQLEAIESICDLFKGQEISRSEFTISLQALGGWKTRLPGMENDIGIGNNLTLLDDQILVNLNHVQIRNGIRPSNSLISGDFTVEMETGTGKTYVYLRTIFELNKRYGFTKFIIVVPSIAIKEGVYKSLEMTSEHFKSLYSGVPFDFFIYDSNKMGQVRNFATNPNIQIMIVTVGAINKKDINNLYKESEKTGGEKPIDLVKSTFPILIIDEPQSVDGGLKGSGKSALQAMGPLCTLRYSATHVDKHHMVYRLNAVDAYERQLVKQIEVASAAIDNSQNTPYLKLDSINTNKNEISATIFVDKLTKDGIVRVKLKVYDGDDLQNITKRSLYKNFRIGEISAREGNKFVELRIPDDEIFLKIGESYGDFDPCIVHRQMIRRTIEEHLQKEIRLKHHGVKVLSLFFIDEVAKYRKYDEKGNSIKGEYAIIFEEEYRRASRSPKFSELFSQEGHYRDIDSIHNGYFSIDRKRNWINTDENSKSDRENAERAYKLIMKDKEKLIKFDSELKFIFSHSALKEGWDNPNIFQICTLRDIGTERERRQTIGRGLRICVNQNFQRIKGFEFNTLTIIATEAYEEFAEKLQKEIENETGIRFGIIEDQVFAPIKVVDINGNKSLLGYDQSKLIWEELNEKKYIDNNGRVTEKLKTAIQENSFSISENHREYETEIISIINKFIKKIEIKNADERIQLKLKKEVLENEDFNELWNRIKQKTTYRVNFDNNKLMNDCIKAVINLPRTTPPRLTWRKGNIKIGESGIEYEDIETSGTIIMEQHISDYPDILTSLQNTTQLTRKSISKILLESNRIEDFKQNPQHFIELTSDAINDCKKRAVIDGIKYIKQEGETYSQELFKTVELSGYLRNCIKINKSVFDNVVYDSQVEKRFAEKLDQNEYVKLFVKLPRWFKINTPLGGYNPDWAVLIEKDRVEKLYFVVETKGTTILEALRPEEHDKIKCGFKHFESIGYNKNPAIFFVADTFNIFENEYIYKRS